MGSSHLQKHPRYRADIPVELVTNDGVALAGSTSDISMGGLFVCTQKPIATGTRVQVNLQFPQVPLQLGARVVHWLDPRVAVEKAHPAGLGLRFESLSEEAHALLKSFLFTLFRQGRRIPVLPPPMDIVKGSLVVDQAEAVARINASAMALTTPPSSKLPGVRRGLGAGDVLNRFAIIDQIGEGGMAQVWLARQKTAEGYTHPVVLKTIAPKWAGNREFIELFLDEGRLAAQLSHPNVVQIFDLDTDEGVPILVMEHLQGRTLAGVMERLALKGMTLPHALAAHIANECCSALHYAHNLAGPDGAPLNVIHRDVTPDNIFITYNGEVKLLDFGIARASQQSHQTLPGCVRGKLPFLSPEQVKAETQDRRVDIWAMGVNLFAMLTGTLPFSGRSELEIFMSIVKHQPPAPSSLMGSVPRQLDALVSRALEKDPTRRFSQMGEMQVMLEAYLRNHDVSSSQLAGVMDTLFPERSDADRKRVAELLNAPITIPPQLTNLQTPPPFVDVAFTDPSAAAQTPPRATPSLALPPTVLAAPPAIPLDVREPAPPQRRMTLLMAAGVGAVAMGGLLFVVERARILADEPAPVVAMVEAAPVEMPAQPVKVVVPPIVVEQPVGPEAAPAVVPVVAAPPQFGKIKVKSSPAADLLVDGKPVGHTPMAAISVGEGNHTLTFIQKRLGIHRHVMVSVHAGKTESLNVRLK